jgi:tripartite-type tricarboxylate transporter receptor subunit TctC
MVIKNHHKRRTYVVNHARLLALVAAIATVVRCGFAAADPLGDFYTGKQITLIVGSDVGGGYDAQARLAARHLGRLLPGHPTIVVQNMPGAGSLLAANHLYNVAAKDGTVIGLIQRSVLTAQLTNPNGVHFDIEKFNWLGNFASETAITLAWHETPFKSIEDVMANEMIIGGTGPSNDSETTPRMLNELIGTKFKIVSGYKGTPDMNLAMERGETQGMGDWSWSNIKTRKPEYLSDQKVRILLQIGLQKLPDLPNVPLAMDYVKNDSDRSAMRLYLSQKEIARPLVAPPSLPAERIANLRAAFMGMFDSVEFASDVAKSKLEVDPMPGEEVQKVIAFIASAPPEVGRRLEKAIEPKK